MSSAVSKPLQSRAKHACLAAAMALVGSTVVASKIIAAGLPFHRHLRCVAGAALLLPHETDRRPCPDSARDWALLTAQAAAGSVGYTVLLITGLQARLGGGRRHHPGRIAAGVRRPGRDALLGERPGATLVAIAIATAGVWLTMASPPALKAPRHWRAMRWCWAPCAAKACSSLRTSGCAPAARCVDHHDRHRPGRLGAGEPAGRGARTLALPADAVLAVAYYALAPTVGGFLLWYAGAARNGAEAALFTAVAPVCAVLLAAACWARRFGPASSPAWSACWRPSAAGTVEPRSARGARTPSGAGRVRPSPG